MLLSTAQYFANNIRLLWLLIIMIIALGASSLMTMPKAEDPQFEMPISVVELIAPGMSPTALETQVVDPIEDSLNIVEDIKSIETEIKHGAVTFTLRFLYGTDPDESFDEVVRAIGRVKEQFPADVRNTLFFKASPITVNVLQLAMSSPDQDWQTLHRLSEKLQQNLQALKDVRQAQVWGMPQLVVEVAVDNEKLIRHNISVDQVRQVLALRASPSHAGYIDQGKVRFSIKLSGEFRTFDQIENTLVGTDNGDYIYVKDIAELTLVPYKENNLAFVDQFPVVFVTAQQRMGASIFEFGAKVNEEIDTFVAAHPEVELKRIFEQEKSVEQRISGFLYDLLSGLILILVCLLFFMGPKQSLWVSLALPLTIFFTLVLLNAMGFVLQQMSIAGLIVALGLLVDNSLVVVEQFVKYKEKGESNIQTIKLVIGEVGLPLIAGTFTTVLAFVPMLLLASDTGDFMRAMPVSVTIALVASLVVALVILPALMSVFGVSKHSKLSLSHHLNHFAENYYARFLTFCLKWPFVVMLVFLAATFACISLFPKVGVSLFPKAEKNIVVVNVQTPQTSSLDHTRDVALALARDFKQMPEVTSVVTTVGSTNPRIYYNHISRRGLANYAQMMLLTDGYDSEKIQALMSQIRTQYQDFQGSKVNVYEFQQGPVTDRPITIRIIGDDLEQLNARSAQLQDFMRKQEKVFDVRNISRDSGLSYDVMIDELKASRSNISLASAEQQVRNLVDGTFVGGITDKYGQNFPVMVRSEVVDAQSLKDIYITNDAGENIPLDAVAAIKVNKLESPYYHYQRSRMAKVSADVLPGGNTAVETAAILDYLDSLPWENGLSYKVGGEEEARKQSFGGLSEIMIMVVLSIFVVLFIQFNSFAQPGVIISLLPIAFAGGVLGMFLTGISFSMMAFIGLISLIGIMVNDAIIVVDGFNRGKAQMLSNLDAMRQSASSRFTPVILTSLTTIVGLLPLTLYGGDLWRPMGTVIITGLLFTTLASLIWVPVMTIRLAGGAKK